MGIPLNRVNWGNYDLVVFDESHVLSIRLTPARPSHLGIKKGQPFRITQPQLREVPAPSSI